MQVFKYVYKHTDVCKSPALQCKTKTIQNEMP